MAVVDTLQENSNVRAELAQVVSTTTPTYLTTVYCSVFDARVEACPLWR